MIRWLVPLTFAAVCCGCASVPHADASLPESLRTHPENFVVVTVRNDPLPVSARAGSTLRGYDGSAQYAVGATAQHAVHSLAAAYGLREISGWPIAELGIHCVVLEIAPGTSAAVALNRLRSDRRVESAQPLNTFATRTASYNDPYQDLQANLASMDVKAAHQWSRGAGVEVAVIDTGVDIAHPDLAGRVAEERNFVDDDDAAFNSDRHGTAIAGVIAADSNNSIGIVGVAPEARLHVYKACWQNAPTQSSAACNTFTLAKGIAAAIDARVQVVNLSLTGPEDPLLTRLVMRGQERGLVFVGAAPQSATGTTATSAFPTAIKGVLKVAAAEGASSTDTLHAPGLDVLTLAPGGRYDLVSGNSLATASVSGAVALLLSRDRNMHAAQIEQLLATSAGKDAAGVNACAALAVLLNKTGCDPAQTVPVAGE